MVSLFKKLVLVFLGRQDQDKTPLFEIENKEVKQELNDMRKLLEELAQKDNALKLAGYEWSITMDSDPDLVVILNLDLHITRCNKAFLNFIKTENYSDVVGKSIYSLAKSLNIKIENTPLDGLIQAIDFSFKTGKEYVIVKPINGNIFSIVVKPIFNENNEFYGVVQRCRDVTSNLAIESKLNEYVKGLHIIIENLEGIGIWWKDVNNKYIVTNSALRKFLFGGLSNEEIQGKSYSELVLGKVDNFEEVNFIDLKPEDLPNLSDNIITPDRYGTLCDFTDEITKSFAVPCKFYEEVKSLKGETVALTVYKTPIFIDGKCIGTVGAFKNVTDRMESKRKWVENMCKEGEAFRIDQSNNYYIRRY